MPEWQLPHMHDEHPPQRFLGLPAEPPPAKIKLQQADLLEVYSDLDKARLKDAVTEDWDVLLMNDPTILDKSAQKYEGDLEWQTDKGLEKDRLLEEIKLGTCAKISLSTVNDTLVKEPVFDMEVFVDDI